MRLKLFWISLLIVCMGLVFAKNIWATATGLNNIPTADIPPTETIVIQQFTTAGSNQRPTHTVGFKTGLLPWLEFGMDQLVGPSPSGRMALQTKVRYQFEDLPSTSIGAGVANVTFTPESRKISGYPFPYVVLTHDLGWGRAHLGFDFQKQNEGVFYGFDKEIFSSVLPGLTFRTDGIMVNNGHDLLSSVGFIYHPNWKLPLNIALESWYSISTAPGSQNDFFLIKWNYIIKF